MCLLPKFLKCFTAKQLRQGCRLRYSCWCVYRWPGRDVSIYIITPRPPPATKTRTLLDWSLCQTPALSRLSRTRLRPCCAKGHGHHPARTNDVYGTFAVMGFSLTGAFLELLADLCFRSVGGRSRKIRGRAIRPLIKKRCYSLFVAPNSLVYPGAGGHLRTAPPSMAWAFSADSL